jgi:hypothetical protein
MADYLAVLLAIIYAAIGAGAYAILAFARSRDPATGEFEEFKSEKFLRTIFLAVAVGGIGGGLGLASGDIAAVEQALGPVLYPLVVILVETAAKALSRRFGWT